MDPKSLAKALQNHNIQRKMLDPERYVTLDIFRDQFPETFPKRMMLPGAPAEGDDGPPISPIDMFAGSAGKNTVLAKYLAGEKVEDSVLSGMFGFVNADLEACLKENDPVIKPLPEKMVLMTFDDSTMDHYNVACPVLERYGGRANLFTTEMTEGMFGAPGFEDKSIYMTWEHIKELSDRGHEIVNHSWHHHWKFMEGTEEYFKEEIYGIEERCARYGIPKPTVFGYPGGGCTRHIEDLLHEAGYLWGRGDLKDTKPQKLGEALYDPYIDTPMVVPSMNPYSEERLKEILDGTAGNRVALFVYHDVNDDRISTMTFEEQVRAIYEYGGRCITFSELSEYVDPVKAYAYTHGTGII